jgi:hypothetical protein
VLTDAPSGYEADDANVSTPRRVCAVIEIERDKSTIKGQIAIDDAPAKGFFGWLELIATLERATTDPPRGPAVSSPAEDGRKSTR